MERCSVLVCVQLYVCMCVSQTIRSCCSSSTVQHAYIKRDWHPEVLVKKCARHQICMSVTFTALMIRSCQPILELFHYRCQTILSRSAHVTLASSMFLLEQCARFYLYERNVSRKTNCGVHYVVDTPHGYGSVHKTCVHCSKVAEITLPTIGIGSSTTSP
eukprot:333087-Amphidinium_carterae.1